MNTSSKGENMNKYMIVTFLLMMTLLSTLVIADVPILPGGDTTTTSTPDGGTGSDGEIVGEGTRDSESPTSGGAIFSNSCWERLKGMLTMHTVYKELIRETHKEYNTCIKNATSIAGQIACAEKLADQLDSINFWHTWDSTNLYFDTILCEDSMGTMIDNFYP